VVEMLAASYRKPRNRILRKNTSEYFAAKLKLYSIFLFCAIFIITIETCEKILVQKNYCILPLHAGCGSRSRKRSKCNFGRDKRTTS